MRAVHTTIDRSVILLEGDADLTLQPTSFARWQLNGVRHQFGAGRLEHARTYATRDLGVTQFPEEYGLERGRLSIGWWISLDSEDGVYRSTRIVGVWEGAAYSIYVTFAADDSDYLVWLFNQFEIEEGPDGVTLAPKNPELRLLEGGSDGPFSFKVIPNLGALDIAPLDPARAATLPDWEGLEVAGGELYRLDPIEMDDGNLRTPLLLVTHTARVYIDLELDVPEAVGIQAVSTLLVEWKGGQPS